MKYVKGVEEKLKQGSVLSFSERVLWTKIQDLLLEVQNTWVCSKFYASYDKEDSMCCLFTVMHRPVVFCLHMSLVDKETKFQNDEIWGSRGLEIGGNSNAKGTNSKWLVTAPTYKEPAYSIYVNLFQVPCNPPADHSLCSQYVRIIIDPANFLLTILLV